MKTLNNYILNEYQKLFFTESAAAKNDGKKESTTKNIKSKEFYTNE